MPSDKTFKKLYLHIGLHKTGTSAIQYALYHARERLKEHGILYPASVAWSDHSHHTLFLPFWREEDFHPAFDDLAEEASASGCETLIISSELLPNTYQQEDRFPALWQRLSALADRIEVILYARRQDRLAESVFKQWCKSDDIKLALQPSAFIADDVRINMDIEKYCTVWSALPGVTRLHLRSYDRCRHDLLASFLAILGLGSDVAQGFNDIRANPTLDGLQLIFRHYTNGLELPQDMSDALLRHILANLPASPRLDIFTLEERRTLLERYAESNRRAFEAFGDGNAQFDEAMEESGHRFRRPTTPEILDLFVNLSKKDKRLASYLFDRLLQKGAPR